MADDFLNEDSVQESLDTIADSESDYDPDLEVSDIEPEDDSLPEGIHFYQTSTTAFKTGRNPRTVRAAYDHSTNTMYVVFYGGVYYMYSDVPPDVWLSFKSAESKGKFLWEEGFDSRGPSGAIYAYQPVDMNEVSPRRRAALASNLKVAEERQRALKGQKTVKTLYPKGSRYTKPNRGGF